MSTPILHDYYRSSAAYRVRIALNMKGIAYESQPVSLVDGAQKSDEYRALNPQGFVPMLEIDGLKLNQSLAIIDYLDAKVPEPRFVAKDAAVRSRQLAMALIIACDIHPLNNLRMLHYLKRELKVREPDRDDWYRHWIGEGFTALEAMAGEGSATYLGGDAPCIADICLVPQMYNARRYEVALDDFPNLVRIDAALTALPAFAAAHPDAVAPAG